MKLIWKLCSYQNVSVDPKTTPEVNFIITTHTSKNTDMHRHCLCSLLRYDHGDRSCRDPPVFVVTPAGWDFKSLRFKARQFDRDLPWLLNLRALLIWSASLYNLSWERVPFAERSATLFPLNQELCYCSYCEGMGSSVMANKNRWSKQF